MSSAITVLPSETTSSSFSTFLATTKNAVQTGIADARASAERALPAVTKAIHGGIYHFNYGLAFGVTFPVVLLAKSVPQNNCLVWGLIDGAKSAQSTVDRAFSRNAPTLS